MIHALPTRSILDFGVISDASTIQTKTVQAAIDAGPGVLVFPAGTYRSGTLHLRSHLTIRLEVGAVLLGSDNIADYQDSGFWGGGFIVGVDLVEVTLEGPGVIDGNDCANPQGEEGFRGPHCLALTSCKNLHISQVTIQRSANWAFNFVSCSDVEFSAVNIRGGHDGVDAMHCQRFTFIGCNFSTGDDCVAGADNADFVFTNCRFNSSCNAFRFACMGLRVESSRFQGPGEYAHKITKQTTMLAAFLHFAPPERRNCAGTQPLSDDWLIVDCLIENVCQLYEFDTRTLWQNGRPVAHLTFRDVTARGLRKPIFVCGDSARHFRLTLERVSLAIPVGSWFHHPFIDLRSFDGLEVRDLTCIGVDATHPPFSTVDGKRFDVYGMTCLPS